MRSQLQFVITAIVLCHLFRGVPLVISQARPEATIAQQSATVPGESTGKIQVSAAEGEPLTIKANQLEEQGNVATLRGDVEAHFRDYILHADTITYDRSTTLVTAEGHISFDGGPHDIHVTASHGTYNVRAQTGKFYDVAGTTGARFKGRNVALTSTSPLAFSGKIVEKTGEDQYVIHHGTVTSCELPHPKWTFSAAKIVVVIGDKAHIYNTVFRVKGVPILYLPFAAPPVERLGRQSGFLLPTFGTSSRKGTILGDSFYWAIDRSMDATVGAEYFSKRGWSMHDTFRARPSDKAYLNFDYFGVMDRGNQGGEDIKLNGETILRFDFRGVASLNYLSSFVFRLAFTENFSQAVDSEVKSIAFLSKTYQGFSVNTFASRYQNFQSTTPGSNPNDVVTIYHAPGLELSSVDQPLGRSRLYWSFDTAAEGLRRTEPGFDTPNLVGRFDLEPDVSLPLFYGGWTFRPEIGLRETFYTETRIPGTGLGTAIQDVVDRRSVETAVEVRPPTLARIFDRPIAGRKVKHTIVPYLIYRYVNGVGNFPSIIRFDYRDILSNTNELEYGLTQRLYLKHVKQDCQQEKPPDTTTEATDSGDAPTQASGLANCTPSGANEFVTWEVKQKYFFDPNFGGAIVNGRRNVLTTSVDFAGIAFLTDPRRFSPIVSRLRVRTTANSDVQWELDYDTEKGRINASTFFTTFHIRDFFLQGSHAYLQVPGEIFAAPPAPTAPPPAPGPSQFNQFRALVGYGSPTKRGVSAAVNVGFDSTLSFIQYSAAQAAYNWDCCGLSFEYRRFALGQVRNENSFRFAFTLANIGTFGNLRRQERLF
jgi:LPS-assembly protein